MTAGLKQLAMELRFQLACRESLVPLMWYYRTGRTRRRRAKDPHYDVRESYTNAAQQIIIDGFPGSANSFATELFADLQGNDCVFGHHFHSPAETIQGLKMGIPVLLTLRHPVDSVCSMVRRWPFVKFQRAMVWYRMFYEAFEPYLDRITVADFSILISDFSQVIESINRKHGTKFVSEVPEDVKEAHKPRTGESREEKRREKEQLMQRLKESVREETVEAAASLYERLVARPGVLRAGEPTTKA